MALRKIPLGRLVLYILLSLLDLVLTRLLIQHNEGQVYEGNPIANWWLTQAGWLGLTAFKLGTVLLVAALSLIIAWYRPRVGGLVLSFACTALAVVVLYSTSLATCLEVGPDTVDDDSLRAIAADKQLLDGEHESMLAYNGLQTRLAADLLARRQTLTEATKRLQATNHGRSQRWLKCLRDRYPGLTDEECLAANMVEFTLRSVKYDAAAVAVMASDFQAVYGTPLPPGPEQRGPTGNSYQSLRVLWYYQN
jgi:hypothetical protein